MKNLSKKILHLILIVLLLLFGMATASAQTDEIQVYDAEIAAPGVFNLMVHNNFTPEGLKSPRFSGGLVPNQTLNGVPEWAYGVTDWFEQGLYLPLYSVANGEGPVVNGSQDPRAFRRAARGGTYFLLRHQLLEFSYNALHWGSLVGTPQRLDPS